MHKIKKRGQLQSQIFIYILVLVIVAMILLFGYKSIKDTQKKGENVVLIQFKTQLKSDIDSISGDYGSVKIKEYRVPSGFDEICFVDLKNVVKNNIEILNHPLIKESVESKAKQNFFLFKNNDFEAYYIEGLELLVYPYYACVQSKTGKISLKIEGKGTGAAIQNPISEKYCTKTEKDGLCDVLEDVFGSWYRDGCCKLNEKCCPVAQDQR